MGSGTSLFSTPPSGLGGHISTNATVHSPNTSNIFFVPNDIVINNMHSHGSGPSTYTAPKPVTTHHRSIAYHLGPNPSAINTSGQLASLIPGSATTENRLVAIDSGSESSAIVASDPLTNQVRGPAIRDNEVAMVQCSESSTIDPFRQEIEWASEPVCPSPNTSVANTSSPRSAASVTDSTIGEPDPDEEYQASVATTSPEIDLFNWRQDFVKEMLKWTGKPGCPNEEAILTMIQFLPSERIAKKSLDADQRRYERRCFSQRESVSESFPIFGRPETEQFDRLKCWVHFNLHLMRGHIWPDGYKPISSPTELKQLEDDDDLSTVFDLESIVDSQADSCIGWPAVRNSKDQSVLKIQPMTEGNRITMIVGMRTGPS